MKVIKFGGSSLASAQQLKKVLSIVKSDPRRRFVVVSAPGKRDTDDIKVTDLLIRYYKHHITGQQTDLDQRAIYERYTQIAQELEINPAISHSIKQATKDLAKLPIKDDPFLYDRFLAAGEDNNAKLIASFFQKKWHQCPLSTSKRSWDHRFRRTL